MTSRRIAALAGAALLGSSLIPLSTGSAQAASGFRAVVTSHGAKIEACKVKTNGGWRVKARLNNRGSNHAHRGGASGRAGKVSFRAAKGKMSKAKRIPGVYRASEFISGGLDNVGAGAPVSWLRRC